MTPEAILKELTDSREFPRGALRAASAQRENMLPVFLDVVERATTTRVSELRENEAILFIFYLFGEWCDPRTYRPLARLLRLDPEALDVLIGDAVTECAARVMAAVCDGDLQPIFDIIEDDAAEEFIRGAMFETLALVALQDAKQRPVVSAFLTRFFETAGSDMTTPVWGGWMEAIAALGLSDMTPLVGELYRREQIDPSYYSFADFEHRIDQTLEDPSASWFRSEPGHQPIKDAAEELSTWSYFSDAYLTQREPAPLLGGDGLFATGLPAPRVNELRNVGRNDPCPCGSGKKFKKCCLQ